MKRLFSSFVTILLLMPVLVSAKIYDLNSDGYNTRRISGSPILQEKEKNTVFNKVEPDRQQLLNRGKISQSGEFIEDTVGQVVDFWVVDFSTNAEYKMPSTCMAVGEHCYVYVGNEDPISQTIVNNIKNEFDTNIYPNDRAIFGSEWTPGIDGDPKITILIFNIKDDNYYGKSGSYIGGYFWSKDEVPAEQRSTSNEREMFYMDSNPATAGSDDFYGTLAHEFQHMIHWNMDSGEETWINEGCSSYAELALGYPPRGISYFFANTNDDVTRWTQQLLDYEQTFLFITYLAEQFGGNEFITKMVADKRNGIDSIEETLFAMGYPLTFDDVFKNWLVANYLDDTSIGDGQYGYSSLILPKSRLKVTQNHFSYPAEGDGRVNSWSGEYTRFFDGYENLLDYSATTTGILIKKSDDNAVVQEFSDSIVMAEFGTTFNEAVLIAKGESASSYYHYATDGSSSTANLTIASSGNKVEYKPASNTLHFTNALKNDGKKTVTDFTVHYFLSADTIITGKDIPMGYQLVSELAGETVMEKSFFVNLDKYKNVLADGMYYGGLILDYSNSIYEQSEADNVWKSLQPVVIGENDNIVDVKLESSLAGLENRAPISLNLAISDVSDKNIFSYGFVLTYETNEIEFLNASMNNSLAQDWGAPTVTHSNGVLRVAHAGTQSLDGSGSLLTLNFVSNREHTTGDSTALNFTSFQLNEGEPMARTADGMIYFQYGLNISGALSYFSNDKKIPNATINLSGDETSAVITNQNGEFSINNLGENGQYTITPALLAAENQSAISAYDASFILRHYVGDVELTPSQMLVADASGNGDLSPLDASIILRYAVDMDMSEYAVGDWIFAASPVNDWQNVSTERTYSPLIQNQNNQDFTGILIGDVSGDWGGELKKTSSFNLAVNKQENEKNYEITFSLGNTAAFHSFEIELMCENPNVLENFILAQVTSTYGRISNNVYKIACAAAEPISADNFLRLIINKDKTENGTVSVKSLKIDNVMQNDFDVAVHFDQSSLVTDYKLMENYPNPFNPVTHISFTLPKESHAKLEVFNNKGQRVALLTDQNYEAGIHSVHWYGSDFGTGIYYYRLTTDEFTDMKKMLFLK